MTKKKTYKVGDTVISFLRRSTSKKVKVKGKIKKIEMQWGNPTYIITAGVVEDFPTRAIKS